jgi:hypothetical protein
MPHQARLDRQLARAWAHALLLLVPAFVIFDYAAAYATRVGTTSVPDLLLELIPRRDVSVLHVYAATSFWLGVVVFLCTRPRSFPYFAKACALFLMVRAGFICLTHLGPPPNELVIPSGAWSLAHFEGDLFFSGHVGGPFLLALSFWHVPWLRTLGLCAAAFFAVVVLVGHIHYGIDVFAAPFITFGIHRIAQRLFARDRAAMLAAEGAR